MTKNKNILSKKIQEISLSPSIKLDAMAKDMIARGDFVINLTAGELDFDTFSEVKQASIKAIRKSYNKYTSPAGLASFRQVIVTHIKKHFNLEYKNDEVIVGNGAKQILYNIFQAILNPGDQVIVPIPAWVSYTEQIKLAGGKAVLVKTKKDFHLDIDAIKKKINKKTKAIVLNTPNNPTSVVYTKAELQALNQVIKNKNIYVISDDIYRTILYEDAKFTSFAQINKQQTLLVDGVSKSCALTGWRVGWCAGNKDVIEAMTCLQSHASGNVCNIAQFGAQAAIILSVDKFKKFKKQLGKRRKYLIHELNKIPEISFFEPEGAFYFFINIKNLEPDSIKFCEKLLKKEKLAVVPGIFFGLDGYIRLSFSNSLPHIKEGTQRFRHFIANYR